MELIDRTFYQLSCDDAMVAIIADYPGLLPASHGRPSGRHAEPAVTHQQGAPKPGRLKTKAVRTETPSQRKNARRTISGEVAGHASTSRAPEPDIEVDSNMGQRRMFLLQRMRIGYPLKIPKWRAP